MDPLTSHDLFEALKGPNAGEVKTELQRRLTALESALLMSAAQGAPSMEFRHLEAALLAVRAGLVTLNQLDVRASSTSASPLDGVLFSRPGAN